MDLRLLHGVAYMAIHGLGDGVINSAMEALGVIENHYNIGIEILSSL